MNKEEMMAAVEAVLSNIRPYLQGDGGDCELVDIDGYIVKLRLHGACGTCPSSQMTLKAGVENHLKEHVDPNIVVERVA